MATISTSFGVSFAHGLDPLVRHVDGASYDHVTDAGACIKNDRSLARVSTLLHLLGRYPADDSGKLTEPPGLGCDRENARSAVPNFRRARLSSGTSPVVSPRATSALYHGAARSGTAISSCSPELTNDGGGTGRSPTVVMSSQNRVVLARAGGRSVPSRNAQSTVPDDLGAEGVIGSLPGQPQHQVVAPGMTLRHKKRACRMLRRHFFLDLCAGGFLERLVGRNSPCRRRPRSGGRNISIGHELRAGGRAARAVDVVSRDIDVGAPAGTKPAGTSRPSSPTRHFADHHHLLA